jgi:hypothetical protein
VEGYHFADSIIFAARQRSYDITAVSSAAVASANGASRLQGASQRLLDHHDVPAHSYHATAKEFSLYACRLFQQKKQAISIQWNELLDDV